MENILSVRNLTKKIGRRIILNNLSFDVKRGKVTGIVGPNGAGKSTLIKTILGLYKIDNGSIVIDGFSVKKDIEKALIGVGAIIENPDMYDYLTGRDNLKIYARLVHNDDEEYINSLIRLVKLENRIDDKLKKYSLGMKQRLGIAASLINKPKILILDEPTNGLDPIGIKELRELIRLINGKTKTSIIICSHILEEMEKLCDEVIMIDNGQINGVFELSSLRSNNMSLEDVFINKLQGSKEQIR